MLGFALSTECELASKWNPVHFWSSLDTVGSSPWAWGLGDLRESALEAKRELVGGTVMLVGTIAVYYSAGPAAARQALCLLGSLTGTSVGHSVGTFFGRANATQSGEALPAESPAAKRRRRRMRCLTAGVAAETGATSHALVPAGASAVQVVD